MCLGYPTAHSGVSVGYLSAEQLKDSLGGQATVKFLYLRVSATVEIRTGPTSFSEIVFLSLSCLFGLQDLCFRSGTTRVGPRVQIENKHIFARKINELVEIIIF